MSKHINIRIFGKVQGIFFRANAKNLADKLKLFGFAQNENDGSVYIEAEGEENQLNKFIEWCNIGPRMAKVEKVIVTEDKLKNFSKFEVY